ncbi:MAG: hydrolase [Solirubrobacterales bacterium]|jgi:ADP-ribose pyrophosphatase YjhB (NUDIX family)|nr:hydrolase [Solirubrobacterales bacterium]
MIPAPLGRLAYKLAYLVLRIGSFVLRPRTRGVKCIVCHGDALLLVRHSYGRRVWDVPGGFARRGEDFVVTARRELAEELSVADLGTVTALGLLERRNMGRHETLGVVRAELPGREVAIRGFELLRAEWFPRDALPAERSEVVDEILALEGGLSPVGQG